ncbi:maleylpyruvate isomerase family mycothiol-dependent enzyme [Tessaracoccus sp. G1721]
MDDDTLWERIDAQRLRTADLLERLTEADWQQPSLCEGWTVRDVAAHLTLQQLGWGDLVRMLPKYRGGGMNRLIGDSAREKAAVPVDTLIAEIRAMAGSRRHNLGVTSRDTLIDIIVHGQDIALPLSLDLPVPVDAAAEAATRVSVLGRRMASVFRPVPWRQARLTATDTAWAVGNGPEVKGPILAILLLLTGRLVALPLLEGEGVASLRQGMEAR